MSALENKEDKMIENKKEYLTFTLGQEEYGIDIQKVQEIRGYDRVTPIANAPDFIKGVINLRGIVVPILDLRIKFGLGNVTYDEYTIVIIINIGERTVGIVVDSVSDVVELAPESIADAPDFSTTLDVEYLEGIGTYEEKMLILIDIYKLLTNKEMGLVDDVVS